MVLGAGYSWREVADGYRDDNQLTGKQHGV